MSILLHTLSSLFSPAQWARRRAFNQLQAGQLAAAALTCDRILRTAPDDALAVRVLADVADGLTAAVERFKREPGSAGLNAERALRKIRMDFVLLLQGLSTSTALALADRPIERAFTALMQSGLRDLARNAEEETAFLRLRHQLEEADYVVQAPVLLAAMLLCWSFDLPLPTSLWQIPEKVRERYGRFLLEAPPILRQTGDADACGAQLENALALFHRAVIEEPARGDSAERRKFADIAATRHILLQAYFTTRNLRPMMQQRGNLIAVALISAGAIILKALPPRQPQPKKIRLGVITAVFGTTTDAYFLTSHIDQLDREKYHITLYAFKSTGNALERHCISRADHFVLLPAEGLQEQAKRIRAANLDLLMFGINQTVGATALTLLGGLRLARTQIATVSSPVTTGLHHVDVMLSAADNEIASGAQQHYTEQLWLMPGSINVYAYQFDQEPGTINFTRANLDIADDTIVFFSGANFFKIIPELSLTWCKILAAVPNSILVLMPFNPNWSNSYRAGPFVNRIQQQFTEWGIAAERLRVLDPVPARADVHRVLGTADIYLDAYPFAGACSMLDPCIVAVPPVVRSGPVGRSLHGAAIMRMADIEEVICTSEESYVGTAIDLAVNPARRARISAALQAVNARRPSAYFDTQAFSSKVEQALTAIHAQYLAPYLALQTDAPQLRRNKIQALADAVLKDSRELAALGDVGLVQSLVKPYFERTDSPRRQHMVDVGACYGQLAEPMLADGWSADLFEPDPKTRSTLESSMAIYGSRCRVFGTAVSNSAAREVAFHQAQTGLSGLGESPYGATEAVLTVPCTTLANFYREQNTKFVDFLKIDAEGFDFEVLDSHDFKLMQPALIMVEYGTHFETESLPVINRAIEKMAAAGYGSVLFNCFDDGHFSEGQFIYRLTHILLDQPLPDLHQVAFGNILFYRSDDAGFLLTLYALLDSCRPRAGAV